MKVFDLSCDTDHVFEGWFASTAEFDHQQQSGVLRCPICDSGSVRRMPAASRLNLGAEAPSHDAKAQATRQWLAAVNQLVAATEDVGERFAEEARRIHYRECEARAIRGVATAAERDALVEEGIEVLTLPLPRDPKRSLQ